MANQLSHVRWGRVLGTALVVYAISFVVVFLIVTVYATLLAVQARGAPDQGMIEAFANQYASWIAVITTALLTFLGARWLARGVGPTAEFHGLVLGVIVGLLSLLFEGASAFSLPSLLATLIVLAAGWFGGRLTARH